MKKVLKFVLYFVIFVLLVLIITPVVFKGKIIDMANQQANKALSAHVGINDVSLSIFRKFPYLSVGLDEIFVVGKKPFEGDTLVSLQRFELVVNPWAMIGQGQIEVQKILLHRLTMNAIVLEDGTANWDIAPQADPKNEEGEEKDTTPGEFNLKLGLKLFSIKHANITYTDSSSKMYASLENYNIDISGNMTKDFSTILVNSNCDAVNFGMGAVNYLSDVVLGMHIDIDANLKENIYVLQENSLTFNELVLKWDGSVEMPDSNQIYFDLKYATSNTNFKTLLSLVPAVYTNDFADLQTSGKLLIEGTVKGALVDDYIPNVDGRLVVSDARIQYPNLPKSIDDINIDIQYHVDGRQMDNTVVDVEQFHLAMGQNPIDLQLQLKTPISDPFINGNIHIDADLATLSDVIPLENTTISGKLQTYIDMMGNLSLIENEAYDQFKADGYIKMNDISYKSADLPLATGIKSGNIQFSPQYLKLDHLNIHAGNSDIALHGNLSNFLPFVFKGETIKGSLSLNSTLIDLNELSSINQGDTTVVEDTSAGAGPLEVIEVPKNIDFVFQSNIKKINYDLMDIDNMIGIIKVKDGVLSMEKISMDALGGNLLVTGEYNTIDLKNPLIDFSMQASTIDIPITVSTFSVAEKIAPVVKNASGKVSMGLNFTSFLQQDMKPVMKTIVGGGNLTSNSIGISETTVMNSLSGALKTEKFKDMVLENIDLVFEIAGGKLLVDPFEVKLGSTSMLIAGSQSFDNILDYDVNISIPSLAMGGQNWTGNLQGMPDVQGLNLAGNENLNIAAKITGHIKDPKISLDWKKTLGSRTDAVKKELKENVQKQVDAGKEKAKAEARIQADKILKEAELQAGQIRGQGKRAADAARKEAEINADKLKKEAKNPLAKAAAEKAADKLINEADKKADKIEKEADIKAQKVLDAAQKKADNLLK